MKTFILLILLFSFSLNLYCTDSIDPVKIYRVNLGKLANYTIYIVDGPYIRKNIFGEFVFGGNPARYPFIPKGEIWIDNAISSSEFKYTLYHEINECNLMYDYNMNYYDAHDSSLSLELSLRESDKNNSRLHEENLPYMCPVDFDSTKEIAALPDSIKLKNVYEYKYNFYDTLNIYIVNGGYIREQIYPDFAFSGSSQAYKFIPPDEMWIDGDVSIEELKYSVILEYLEGKFMLTGQNYDDAYAKALEEVIKIRKNDDKTIEKMNFLEIPGQLYREFVR